MDSDKSPLFKLLDKVSFFNDFLESEKCELIDKKVLIKKYEKKGSTIFREGDKGGSVIVILAGEVSVIKSTVPATNKGKISLISPKDIAIAKLGAGSVLGEISLLSKRNRTTGVVTSTPLVIALEINKWHLQSFNSSIQSKFHEQFISILIKRLEDMNKKFGRSQLPSPPGKS